MSSSSAAAVSACAADGSSRSRSQLLVTSASLSRSPRSVSALWSTVGCLAPAIGSSCGTAGLARLGEAEAKSCSISMSGTYCCKSSSWSVGTRAARRLTTAGLV